MNKWLGRWIYLCFLIRNISLVDAIVTSNRYILHTTCGNQVLDPSLRFLTVDVSNNLECAKYCSNNAFCISYNYYTDMKRCHLYKGVIKSDCSNAESQANVLYFENADKICYNTGEFNTTTLTCNCVNSYVGTQCKRLMTGCAEGWQYWYYSGQLNGFTVLPKDSPGPLQIVCRMAWGGRTIVMQHYDPNIEYNMSWQGYKAPFIITNDFTNWIGLDNLHYITKSSRFKILFEIKNPTTYEYFVNGYDDFKIDHESTGYKLLSIGNQIMSDLDTCLSPDLIGKSFSTFDNDQDQNNTVNCAAVYGIGWWFHPQFCSRCNPFGKLKMVPGGDWNGDRSYTHWPGIAWNPTTVKIWLEEMTE